MFGICNLSIVPCRAEPSDKSEMVTQLLFGDHFYILERIEKWVKIRIAFDKYECWISHKQFKYISENTFELIESIPAAYSSDIIQTVKNINKNYFFTIPAGCNLPFIDDNQFNFENDNYLYEGILHEQNSDKRKGIVADAMIYRGTPYLWGGKSPFGIDCSGLVQMVYKLNGINLPRDAKDQANCGKTLSFIEEAEPGDLAFFDNDEGFIIHTGIILPENKIIHASGSVRIDMLDHQGIYNSETKSYSHQLRILKSLI